MTSDTSDTTPGTASRLHHLVDVWHRTCRDLLQLLEELDDHDWTRPTDLPGWDVKAVASHLAHLESELAGMPQHQPQQQADEPQAPHVRNLLGQYTEVGPAVRRSWPTEAIVDKLRTAVDTRLAQLRDDPPADLSQPGPSFAALAGWSWETLLTNRPLDLWMHEQDIRRAVDHPGGSDTPGAVHAAGVFARSLPMVVGKRAEAHPGQSVVLELSGPPPDVAPVLAVAVGDDRRARVVEAPAEPTVTLRLGFEDWMRRCGGRCAPEAVTVEIAGDDELGRRVLDGLAVTP
jgi:uncharacterized protein (TIGR03083 family)